MKNISDILHDADDKTIKHIAEKYTAADKKTQKRIYAKSLEKLNIADETSEAFIAEPARRSPVLRSALIIAACFAVLGGAVAGLLKMKAPSPAPVDIQPVIAVTATTVTGTDNAETTTETTAETVENSTETNKVKTNTDKTETVVTTADNSSKDTGTKSVQTTAANGTTSAKLPNNVKTTSKPIMTMTVKKTTVPTVTTTAPKANSDKHMTLAEIEEWERKNVPATLVRERAILNGEISANSPRLTIYDIQCMIVSYSDFRNIYSKIRDNQPYPDVIGGSGVTLIEYWVDGSRNDIVLICPENESIFHITSTDGKFYSDNAIREELYTEPRVTTPPVTVKPEFAGQMTIDEVLELAKNSNDLQFSNFRKYCSSPDYYDTSHMKFRILNLGDWYLTLTANKDRSIAACSIVDNVGHHSVDICRTQYQEVLNSVNEWMYTEAVESAPIVGSISIDDVLRLNQEKGENLLPSDMKPYTDDFNIFGESMLIKYKVTDGEIKVIDDLYLTLTLGSGRPLLSAALHNKDLSDNTDIMEYDLNRMIATNSEKAWFLE